MWDNICRKINNFLWTSEIIRKINNLSKLGSNIINNHLSDELKSDSYDIHFLASTSPDVLINLMDVDYDFVNKNIEQLE